jgi:hypothetical protein
VLRVIAALQLDAKIFIHSPIIHHHHHQHQHSQLLSCSCSRTRRACVHAGLFHLHSFIQTAAAAAQMVWSAVIPLVVDYWHVSFVLLCVQSFTAIIISTAHCPVLSEMLGDPQCTLSSVLLLFFFFFLFLLFWRQRVASCWQRLHWRSSSSALWLFVDAMPCLIMTQQQQTATTHHPHHPIPFQYSTTNKQH